MTGYENWLGEWLTTGSFYWAWTLSIHVEKNLYRWSLCPSYYCLEFCTGHNPLFHHLSFPATHRCMHVVLGVFLCVSMGSDVQVCVCVSPQGVFQGVFDALSLVWKISKFTGVSKGSWSKQSLILLSTVSKSYFASSLSDL